MKKDHAIINPKHRLPKRSADYPCIFVFPDGSEAPSDGMTVCLHAEKTPHLIKGWREIEGTVNET